MSKKERIEDYLDHLDKIHEVAKERQTFLSSKEFASDTAEEVKKILEKLQLGTPTEAVTTGDSSSTSSSSSYDNQDTLQGKATAGGFVIPSESSLVPIVGGKVQIPNKRGRHIQSRIETGQKTNYAGYVKLPTDKFWFVESVGGPAAFQNNFAPDFAEACLLLYDALVQSGYLKSGSKLQINSGLRSKPVTTVRGAHMCGCAIDVGTPSMSKDRYLIADIAWGLGMRSIALGKSFVHIENLGEAHWSYPGVPQYNGPGTY